MFKMKRSLAFIVALVVGSSLIATGCGEKEKKADEQKTAQTVNQEKEVKPVKLTWYVRNQRPNNADLVMKKVNELLDSKIKVTLDMQFINPGDYVDKMNMIMSAQEEYDLCFTSGWANDYVNNVNKGAYIPLDDLVAKYPGLKKIMPDQIWNATKVKGKMYGVPNNQIMYNQGGLWFKKDLIEKYKIDLSKVKKLSDLTPIYQLIKDKEPDIIPARSGQPKWFANWAPEIEGLYAVDTKTWKVYDQYETDFVENFKILREWYTKGFLPYDIATLKDETPLLKAGKVFSRENRYKPGSEAEVKQKYGYEVVAIPAMTPVLDKTGVIGALTAISATSKNPDRAMALIDIVNSDKELYNTMIFGLEGQDYTKKSANLIESKTNSYLFPGWLIGNVYNSFLIPGQADNVWEETKKGNETAVVDPLIDFSFDRKGVENEVAQLKAIHKEFGDILKNGLDDPEKILKARSDKMKAAGDEKVKAEMQKQIDEWRKAKR